MSRCRLPRLIAKQESDARNGRPFNFARHLAIRRTQLKRNATAPEKIFHKKLIDWGYRVMFQKGFLAGGVVYVADFYLPKPYRLVIEVDGSSHFTKEGREKDEKRDAYFKSRGFRVLHITNEQAMTMEQSMFNLKDYVEGESRSLKRGYFDVSGILDQQV